MADPFDDPFAGFDFTPTRGLKDLSVLLAEDNGPSRALISGLLRKLGFSNITVAADGEEAVAALTQAGCAPDLILCDWQMPGIDGLDILAIVREGFPDAVFIMVTATDSIEAAMLAKAHGAHGYLLKPVTREKLLKVISETVSRVHGRE